jgi:outer membrane protein assembly factor BamB
MPRAHALLSSAAAVALTVAVDATGAAAQNATAYQINPQHTGAITLSTSFAPPFTKRWQIDLRGAVSYPLIVGDEVFVTVGSSSAAETRLYALELASGHIIWQKVVTTSGAAASAGYDQGRLVVLSQDGSLQAFAPKTGAPLWTAALGGLEPGGSVEPPVGSGGNFYVASSSGESAATTQIVGSTGAVGWSVPYFGGSTEPAVGGGNVFVDTQCSLTALAAASGSTVWQTNQTSCFGGGSAMPIYAKGRVFAPYIGTINDAKTGTVLRPLIGDTLTVAKSYRYTVIGGQVVAIEPTTGNTAWTFAPVTATVVLPPIVVNSLLFVYTTTITQKAKLFVLDAATGKVLQELLPAPATQPGVTFGGPVAGLAAGQDTVIVPSGGELVAYGP